MIPPIEVDSAHDAAVRLACLIHDDGTGRGRERVLWDPVVVESRSPRDKLVFSKMATDPTSLLDFALGILDQRGSELDTVGVGVATGKQASILSLTTNLPVMTFWLQHGQVSALANHLSLNPMSEAWVVCGFALEFIAAVAKRDVGTLYHSAPTSFWTGDLTFRAIEPRLITPSSLISIPVNRWRRELSSFMKGERGGFADPFFSGVAEPLFAAGDIMKDMSAGMALSTASECQADDWRIAACQWIEGQSATP